MQKYIKLISKGEWFDKDTEVFRCVDTDHNVNDRLTLEEWEKRPHGPTQFCLSGLRMGKQDEELCECDEFTVEIVDENKTIDEYIKCSLSK